MTLCMAAICSEYETNTNKIVICADRRAEADWAGGDVALKFTNVKTDWPTLIAGGVSKASDFVATCQATLSADSEPITRQNILDKFFHASNTYKQKLCERHVRQRLGIDYERFLTRGENELSAELRTRIFYELAELEFGCELLICGFTGDQPHIIEINTYGEVIAHQGFGAIGNGSVIAKSTLYQREQSSWKRLSTTIYHLYEAAKLAHKTAPGVGAIGYFIVLSPPSAVGERIGFQRTTPTCREVLDSTFEQYGPKSIKLPPALTEECFEVSQVKSKAQP